jgi:hypothetical protein
MIDVPVNDRVTPGNAAPEESVMRPVMTPSCAKHVAATNHVNNAANGILVSFAMTPPERSRRYCRWDHLEVIQNVSKRSARAERIEVARNLRRGHGRGKRNVGSGDRSPILGRGFQEQIPSTTRNV